MPKAASTSQSKGSGSNGSNSIIVPYSTDSKVTSSSGNGKGKNKASKESAGQQSESVYNFSEKGRRAFTTETYTVYASLQAIASSLDAEELETNDQHAMAVVTGRHSRIPGPEQIAYYSRFAQLYRDCLGRFLHSLTSADMIDTKSVNLIASIKDIFHLAQLIFVPEDGRGDGIVSEELADWVNSTSPWPSSERREALTGTTTPYENGDFWGFIYSCVLRGHFNLASSVLKKLLGHPSPVLQRLTQSCLDLISTLPRSNSPSFAYESSFLSALRAWRSKLSALLSRLDLDMDEYQEEIEAEQDEQDEQAMEEASDERYEWQAGFKSLLMLLAGDTSTSSIVDAAEDGWKSALTAWCLLVRPGLKRDDLPETIQTIVAKLPGDQTLFKESMSIALLSGDVPKILRLAADEDPWLVAHLCDLFEKLGLLIDSAPVKDDLSLRDYFVLGYADILTSDTTLWRCTVDYLGSLENTEVGMEKMKKLLLDIGSIASPEAPVDEPELTTGDQTMDEHENAVEQVKKAANKPTTVEDVLAVSAIYGLEDVAKSVCLSTADKLIAEQKYGPAIAYCVRADDSKKINKIADLILDEYIERGIEALSLIDTIPTSLLHPNAASRATFDEDQQEHAISATAFAVASATKLSFLARYRDFQALYASGDRKAAAELLVLLMSSNAAPKKFWAVMLLDSVPLLNDPNIPVSEENTLELMRCLTDITLPLQETGRDLYQNFEGLTRVVASNEKKGKRGTALTDAAKSEEESESVATVLRQMDVVRFALTQNLSRCYMHQ